MKPSISMLICLLALSFASQAYAAEGKGAALLAPPTFDVPAKEPDPTQIKILETLKNDGAKIFYLGRRSDLDGWVVAHNKKLQMIYVTPDRNSVIMGGMFTGEGDSVSSLQMEALLSRDKNAEAAISVKKTKNVEKSGGGEALYNDLLASAGVSFGNDNAPQMLMIIAPQCPHCHAAWQSLRQAVIGGKLRIKIIPIARNADEEAQAAALLLAEKPFEVWEAMASDKPTEISRSADESKIKAVRANFSLMEMWNITGTPFTAYKDKQGKVKIISGAPKAPEALLSDLTP